jgi:hypothetical protein
MRIALSASQSQIMEHATPEESEDGQDLDEDSGRKQEQLRRLDMAQEAVLSAIGFMSENERQKKGIERRDKGIFSLATGAGLVNYHLPLPLSCQRNQILVNFILDDKVTNLRRFDMRKNRICLYFRIVGDGQDGR